MNNHNSGNKEINELLKDYRKAVRRLAKSIETAAACNSQVAELFASTQDGWRNPLPMLHWPDLKEETSTRQTKLSTWRRQVDEYLSPDRTKASPKVYVSGQPVESAGSKRRRLHQTK